MSDHGQSTGKIVYDIVVQTLQVGAPGISEQTRHAIATSASLKAGPQLDRYIAQFVLGREILQAASITLGRCDFCPGVHINLLDAAGTVFATAVIGVDIKQRLLEDLNKEFAELARIASAPARRQ